MLTRACLGLLSAVLFAGAVATGSPASGATLRVGGSGAVSEVLRQMAPVFEADTGISLEVLASLGTAGAEAALLDGVLGIVVASRDLSPQDVSRGLRVATTFLTPYGLATSRAGPDGLKSNEIAALYRADKPVWPDGTPVLFVLRPANQSDTMVLGAMFPGMVGALQFLRKRNDISVVFTDQANADMGEKTKGSLVGSTLTQIDTEKRNLRFVAIDGVAASLENFENGSYPYAKTLYVVVPATVSPEAAAFVAFLAKPAAVAFLRKAGIVAGHK